MAENLAARRTSVCQMAKTARCEVVPVDMGMAGAPVPGVVPRRIAAGTADFTQGPAMTRTQAVEAIAAGIELVRAQKAQGCQLLATGEMGIGNTTTSAAVLAALTHAPAQAVTGRGGGLTDAAFEKKKQVIDRALALHRPDPADPVGVLAAVGGLDLAAMTGAFLGCAQNHVPAVVDGYISIVAALTAVRLCPAAGEYLFLSHASYEIGYRIAAQELGQEPCLLLGMRLGEGSGCPVMFQILRAACAVMDGMATFPEAAIEDDYLAPIRAQDSFTVTP